MSQARKERLARNEATFRSINEDLERGLHTLPREDGELSGFVCECSRMECACLVHLPLDAYERIRSDPRRFLVVPGHDLPEVEDVVDEGDGYAVVQKREDVRAVVEASDPRGQTAPPG